MTYRLDRPVRDTTEGGEHYIERHREGCETRGMFVTVEEAEAIADAWCDLAAQLRSEHDDRLRAEAPTFLEGGAPNPLTADTIARRLAAEERWYVLNDGWVS